jgi:hypothetical protein
VKLPDALPFSKGFMIAREINEGIIGEYGNPTRIDTSDRAKYINKRYEYFWDGKLVMLVRLYSIGTSTGDSWIFLNNFIARERTKELGLNASGL